MQTVNGDILIGGSAGVIGSPESAVDERYHVYKRDVTQTWKVLLEAGGQDYLQFCDLVSAGVLVFFLMESFSLSLS